MSKLPAFLYPRFSAANRRLFCRDRNAYASRHGGESGGTGSIQLSETKLFNARGGGGGGSGGGDGRSRRHVCSTRLVTAADRYCAWHRVTPPWKNIPAMVAPMRTIYKRRAWCVFTLCYSQWREKNFRETILEKVWQFHFQTGMIDAVWISFLISELVHIWENISPAVNDVSFRSSVSIEFYARVEIVEERNVRLWTVKLRS